MWTIQSISVPAGTSATIIGGAAGQTLTRQPGDVLGPQGAQYTVLVTGLGYLTLTDVGWGTQGWAVLVNGRSTWFYNGGGAVSITVDAAGNAVLNGGVGPVQERLLVGDLDLSLGGWDTISSLTLAGANAALASNAAELPAQFSSSGSGAALSGSFGAWQITGGRGQFVYLTLPITAGSLAIDGLGSVDLSGISTVMELSLRLVPSNDGSTRYLSFAMQQAATPGTPPAPGFVTGSSVIDPTGRLAGAQQAILLGEMANALVADAGQVAYVLASINVVAPSSGGWLTPVQSAYVFTQPTAPDMPGYLSILSVTDTREIIDLPPSVPSVLTASSPNLAFGIASHLFLGQQVLPALPSALGSDASSSAFALDATGAIVNTTQIGLGGTRAGAITYYPQIDTLRSTIVGGNLNTSVQGHCDLYAGISMTFSVSCSNGFSFNPATQTISFQPDPNPQSDHSADIPWYFKWLAFAVGAIAEAVVALIANSLAESLDSSISGAATLAVNDMSINWTGVHGFAATSGKLDGALVLASSQQAILIPQPEKSFYDQNNGVAVPASASAAAPPS